MKNILIAFICTLMILSFCACTSTITDDTGDQCKQVGYNFAVIDEGEWRGDYLVYDIDTKIVYYYQTGATSDGGHLSPYLVYQDGAIYGTIFENGKIKPVPYISAPLE